MKNNDIENRDFDTVNWLRQHYIDRKDKNTAYSLRAFARDINVPSGRLSELLSRRRPLTPLLFKRIVRTLETEPSELLSVTSKVISATSNPQHKLQLEKQTLLEDQTIVISEWYHFAILSLINTNDFNSDPKWIARRLGLENVVVREAIDRLVRCKLIDIRNGSIVRLSRKLITTTEIPSRAVKTANESSICKALESLSETSISKRHVTGITMSISSSKISDAKKEIERFKRRMERLLEVDQADEVYDLNILFTPLTKPLDQ